MLDELTVIKVGTGVLTRESDGQLDTASLTRLVTAVSTVIAQGHRCILVSSGAVGAGIASLGLTSYPDNVRTRQACAAVGQTKLMHSYESLFKNFDIQVAQLLLTAEDFSAQDRASRVTDTVQRLLEVPHIIPIINENDSVAVEELSVGDNDMLSARVSELIGAKRLILLTTVDGLYPPGSSKIIAQVDNVTEVLDFARSDSGKFSIGGMKTKLQAVELATSHGTETIIANGRSPENLIDLLLGSGEGTRFKSALLESN